MATNFQLLSSSASSCSSSDDNEDTVTEKKLDLSYHEMDDSSLAFNLQDFANDQTRYDIALVFALRVNILL